MKFWKLGDSFLPLVIIKGIDARHLSANKILQRRTKRKKFEYAHRKHDY